MTDDAETPGKATDTAAGGVEIELKYRVDDRATADRVLEADHLGELSGVGARTKTTQIEDRYVDTADRALERAGFAVRLRQRGAATIVSVKSLQHTEATGGASRRQELEGPADRVAPPADWPASDARSMVLEHAGDAPFVERVTVRQLRHKRVFRSGPTRVELSLDEVDVVHRGRIVSSFVELEAELMSGDEALLDGVATAIRAKGGATPSSQSKLAAALVAVAAAGRPEADQVDGGDVAAESPPAPTETVEPSKPSEPSDLSEPSEPSTADGPSDPSRLVVGKTPGVTADDHVAEAGRKVMRFHLARMLDYEAGTRSGADAEDLHKMRVATRRQRAAWRVFGASFRPARTKRYRSGLREIAGRLGAVRDLDVQLEAADAYRADLPTTEQRAMEPLLASWREHRDEARVLMLRELDSDGYRRFVDDYRDFVRTEGAFVLATGPVEPHHVRDTAPSRIWTAYEGVRAYEPVLRWADVETLHELRIAGKWLRYTIEFVREALGPEATPLIERVVALQDHLGLMNDAHITAGMARTFLVEHAGGLSTAESAAIGRYLIDREREVARLRRTVGAPWRGVAGLRFRRGLARVAAAL